MATTAQHCDQAEFVAAVHALENRIAVFKIEEASQTATCGNGREKGFICVVCCDACGDNCANSSAWANQGREEFGKDGIRVVSPRRSERILVSGPQVFAKCVSVVHR